MASSPGVRVFDVPKDASQRDIKVYFSNPRNGGAKITRIYYPLQGNDAVVLFEREKVNPKIFQMDHVLRGRNLRVRPLQRQVFSKVTVELGKEITSLLDNDPKYLDDIQYDGELEVIAEDNYTITGDWYQIEWAWQYLDDVCNKSDDTVEVIPNGIDQHAPETLRGNSDDSVILGATSIKSEDDVPLLQYPHHTEQASGFQPYWKDSDERHSSDSRFLDPFAFDDDESGFNLLTRGLDMPHTGFPWLENNLGRKQQTGYNVSRQDFQDVPLTYEFNVSSLKISVLMNDLLQETTDAIVTSASGDLSAQYGISRVIAHSADPKLRSECREYIDRHGQLSVGDVMHTSAGGAFDKKVGFVIHAVGPSWREYRNEESVHMLTCTYLNIFQYSSSNMWLTNIAMPLIGAGGVGFPLDVCVQAFYDALLLFVMDPENLSHLQEIHLVSNDEDSTCSTIVVLRSLLDIDQISTQEAAKDRYLKRTAEFGFKAKNLIIDREEELLGVKDEGLKSNEPEGKQPIPEVKHSGYLKEVEPVLELTDGETISLSPKETTVSFTKSVSSNPDILRSTEPVTETIKEWDDTEKTSAVPQAVTVIDSSSSDESIPFGMIDSDEDDTIPKKNLVLLSEDKHQSPDDTYYSGSFSEKHAASDRDTKITSNQDTKITSSQDTKELNTSLNTQRDTSLDKSIQEEGNDSSLTFDISDSKEVNGSMEDEMQKSKDMPLSSRDEISSVSLLSTSKKGRYDVSKKMSMDNGIDEHYAKTQISTENGDLHENNSDKNENSTKTKDLSPDVYVLKVDNENTPVDITDT
ncbi:uncharacterized protein LOC127732519 [Mytilus californianus]|uniref:uncharacterized protein LOC127732519 n=1 Tax=Mytilus californianus TaxID=6549 RepID=UPI0022478E9E|nr:uncharacterized protein LOC127732519 [Mytilus californianus]